MHWVRRAELGTIEQERESSKWMWLRVVYQSQPSSHKFAQGTGVMLLYSFAYFPSAAVFVGWWGVVAGVALGFLMVMSHRSQHRRVMRSGADGVAMVLVGAKRCPVCRSPTTPRLENTSLMWCEPCGCSWRAIKNQFATKPKSWTVDHRDDPCAALTIARAAPGGEADGSIWTPAEYREFLKSIKHRHFGPAIAPFAGWAMLLVAAVATLPCFIGIAQRGFRTLPNMANANGLFVFVFGVVWVYAGYRLTRSFGIDADTMRKEMLARARCAACGYALSGIPREDDGCTICPECAAAWRVPDLSQRGAHKSADLTDSAP